MSTPSRLPVVTIILIVLTASAFFYWNNKGVDADLRPGQADRSTDAAADAEKGAGGPRRHDLTASEQAVREGDSKKQISNIPGAVKGMVVAAGTSSDFAGLALTLTLEGRSPKRVHCDQQGCFEFAGVVASSGYALEVRDSELVLKLIDGITVNPGRTTELGIITISLGSTLRGKLTLADGRGVGGARVLLTTAMPKVTPLNFDIAAMAQNLHHQVPAVGEVSSAEDGTFEFDGLRDGDYFVVASRSGLKTTESGRIPVRRSTPAPTVSIMMPAAPLLKGIVQNEDGLAVAGARVSVMAAPRGMPQVLRTESTESGADGRFAYDNLMPGRYFLMVKAEGYADLGSRAIFKTEEDVVVTMKKGVRLKGTVTEKPSGRPLGDVKVTVLGGNALTLHEATTDPRGQFEIAEFPSKGSFIVKLAHQELAQLQTDGEMRPSIMGGSQFRFTGSEGPVRELDLHMVRRGIVSGKILDSETGAGIAGARVRVIVGRAGLLGSGKNEAHVVSGPDGSYEARVGHAGPIMVMVMAKDHVMVEKPDLDTLFNPKVNAKADRIALGEEITDFDILMLKGVTVTGKIIGSNGELVSHALVKINSLNEDTVAQVLGEHDKMRTRSKADGSFEFAGMPRQGDYRIRVLHPRYSGGGEDRVTLSQSDATGLVIELREGASIKAVVKDQDGVPIPAAPVRLKLVDSYRNENAFYAETDSRSVLSDKDGRFNLSELPLGRARFTLPMALSASHELDPGSSEIVLESGRQHELVLVYKKRQ